MDHRQVRVEEVVADRDLDRGAEAFGEAARRLLEVVGAEVVRRRVDEVAPVRDGARDQADLLGVDALGREEPDRGDRALEVALEPVAGEQPGQRRRSGVGGRVGEHVIAGRQRRRELARGERVGVALRLAEAEQHRAETPLRRGQERDLAGLAAEPGRLREGAGGLRKAGRERRPGRQQVDRNGRGTGGREAGIERFGHRRLNGPLGLTAHF